MPETEIPPVPRGDIYWRVSTRGQIIYLRKTNDLCKRKLVYFFVHFFLLFSEKEERKRTKERRKNRCDHSLKIRSKSTSEFWEQVTAENAPASAFLVLNLRITDETPRKCEAWASIFVEMYALHFVPSLESQPFKISHGLSFCFLWLVSFLFLFRKKKRKKVTKKSFT